MALPNVEGYFTELCYVLCSLYPLYSLTIEEVVGSKEKDVEGLAFLFSFLSFFGKSLKQFWRGECLWVERDLRMGEKMH